MNRHVSLPVAAALLAAVLVVAFLLVRAIDSGARDVTAGSPHTPVAGFEPSADNVTSDLMGRLHVLRNRVEADAADTTALLELARVLHDAHEPAEAALYYRRYLDANPANTEAWFDLADSHGRAGDWVAARAVIETLLERLPEDGAALYNMGVIEIQLGNTSAARGWLERAAGRADPETAGRARDALKALEQSG